MTNTYTSANTSTKHSNAGRQGFSKMGWRKFAGNPLLERLASPHGVSQYLENINPLWSLTDIRAKVVARQQETADATTLQLKTNGNWHGFKAGQFVTVTVEIAGRQVSRCYSISSAESDPYVSITVRRKAGGEVSNFIADHTEVGDVLTLSAAGGEFVAPTGDQPLLLVAAGSGITPIMSMLRSLNWATGSQPVTLLYYVRGRDGAIFLDELTALAAQQPRFELQKIDPEFDGHYSAAQLNARIDDVENYQTLLCGPASLMAAVEADYAARGLANQLLLERFTLPEPTMPDDSETVAGDVMFSHSERYAANNGQNLLDQAEAAGLQPEFGCRRGICHRCSCNKTAGAVKDLITGEISARPNETIRLCVSVPVGDVTLDL